MSTAAVKAQAWPVHSGVAKDLVVGDYLEVIGDGRRDRAEQLVCRVISSIMPANRRNHVEVMLAAVTSKGERARWLLHQDYPVTYRRDDWAAPRELQIHG